MNDCTRHVIKHTTPVVVFYWLAPHGSEQYDVGFILRLRPLAHAPCFAKTFTSVTQLHQFAHPSTVISSIGCMA